MSPRTERSLDEAIGSELASIRERKGWTRDDLRRELMESGFAWLTLDVVKAIETGRRRVRVTDLIALGWVLGVAPGDLVPISPATAVLEGRVRIDTSRARGLLGGAGRNSGALVTKFRRLFDDEEITPEAEEWLEHVEIFERLVPRRGQRAQARRFSEGRFERRLASVLAVPPWLIGAASVRLWGRSATEERNERASTPHHRHAESRKIREEIRDVINEHSVKVSSAEGRR